MYKVGDIIKTESGWYVLIGFSKVTDNSHSCHVYSLFTDLFLENISFTYALFYPLSRLNEAFSKQYVRSGSNVENVLEKSKERMPVENFLVKNQIMGIDMSVIVDDAKFRESIQPVEKTVKELEGKLKKEPRNEIYRYTKVVDLEKDIYRSVETEGIFLDDNNILSLESGMLYKIGELQGRTWGEKYFKLLTNPMPNNKERYKDEGKHSFLLKLRLDLVFVYNTYLFCIKSDI